MLPNASYLFELSPLYLCAQADNQLGRGQKQENLPAIIFKQSKIDRDEYTAYERGYNEIIFLSAVPYGI